MLQGRWGTLDDVIKYNCGIVFAHAEKVSKSAEWLQTAAMRCHVLQGRFSCA
jgi:hypothetical protein